MRLRLLSCAALAALSLPLVANAESPVTDVQRFDVAGPYYASCVGEVVDLSGQFMILSHTTFDNDGIPHFVFHFNASNFRGIGETTGLKYVATRASTQTYNPNGLPPLEFTTTYTEKLVSQGKSQDLVIRITAHTTVNANGQMTANINTTKLDCT